MSGSLCTISLSCVMVIASGVRLSIYTRTRRPQEPRPALEQYRQRRYAEERRADDLDDVADRRQRADLLLFLGRHDDGVARLDRADVREAGNRRAVGLHDVGLLLVRLLREAADAVDVVVDARAFLVLDRRRVAD